MRVVEGAADLHLPLLKDPNVPAESLPYAYSTGTFAHVPFILYTSKANTKVNKDNVQDSKVFVIPAHLGFFKGAKGEMSVESGLQRLESNEIDGYICAMSQADAYIKDKGLKNIDRHLFFVFEAKAVIPKGEKGQAIDKAFTTALETLRANGTLEKVYPEFKFVE